MTTGKGKKNKLLKGLTEHDVLTWEEEKVRYQRRAGKKVTDLDFLRYLLMNASRPLIASKEGVAGGFLTGSGPVYQKEDTLLGRFRTESLVKETISSHNVDELLKCK